MWRLFLALAAFVVLLHLVRYGILLARRVWWRALCRVLWLGGPELRLRLSRVLRFVPGAGFRQLSRFLRADACRDLGQTLEGVQAWRQILEAHPRAVCPWGLVNLAVDALVNAALYAEALRTPELWPEKARQRGKQRDEVSFAIVQINQAEALHNLGSDQRALTLLDSVVTLTQPSPLALNGLRCLRAWILVHDGQLEAARRELFALDVRALPRYAPEVNYTFAALARECGNLVEALQYAESGLALARTASSRRNGQFMVAGILALLGEATRARSLFDAAVASVYQGQGGDGLLRFATFLEGQGSHDDAVQIRHLLLERDPESRFATTARTLLGT